jgi:hypothetical protein
MISRPLLANQSLRKERMKSLRRAISKTVVVSLYSFEFVVFETWVIQGEMKIVEGKCDASPTASV